eukprot:Nitzschia sp. Nitz4//scaffold136_size62208//36849//37206//NITZ4_006372-RA/size62208-exonerate_est2genome-gene-0.7-mRNA-1//-1//CDS//3329535630//2924//frame0
MESEPRLAMGSWLKVVVVVVVVVDWMDCFDWIDWRSSWLYCEPWAPLASVARKVCR